MKRHTLAIAYGAAACLSSLALQISLFGLHLPHDHWAVTASGVAVLALIIGGLPVFVITELYCEDSAPVARSRNRSKRS